VATIKSLAHPESVSPLNKGLGRLDEPAERTEIAGRCWNLLNEDLSLPAAVLYQDKIEHNLAWMRKFVDAYDAKLCPHGKTTMAPQLFKRQIEAGAWGITLANPVQTRVAYEHGIRRVLLANQLVGRQNLEIVSELLKDPEFEFYCLVDSPDHIRLLGEFFGGRGQSIQVFIEVGTVGGRAGIRDESQIEAIVAEQRKYSSAVSIVGVELFEGIFQDEPSVRAFLQRVIDSAKALVALDAVERSPVMISGAGSAWFDVVAEMLTPAEIGAEIEVILRPGCYVTHDCGSYSGPQKRMLASNAVAKSLGTGLLPSLHIWAYVQSRPTPSLAIVGFGKRDASFDNGLPTPALWYRPGAAAPATAPPHWQVPKIMDQHAFLEIEGTDDLRIGDMVAFDISHPCLTFDKWKYLALVDRDYTVVDLIQTYF
jgi:D-serine dehydratase